MPLPAQVTSVEAIESFRAGLILYLNKARAALDEVGAEVQRTHGWLEIEQRRKWEREWQIRRRRLEEAKAELFSARFASSQGGTALQLMAVQRAERAVQEAEAKLAVLKRWEREMPNRTDPLTKQAEQLQGFLALDMGKGVHYLTQVIKALDAYTGVTPPAAPAPGTKGPAA